MCKEKLSLQIPDSDRTIVIDLLTNQEEGIILIPTGTKLMLPNKRGLFGQRRFNKGLYVAKIKPLDCKIEFSKNPLLCSFLHSEFANDCPFEINGESELPYSIALDKKAFLNFQNVVLTEDQTFELPFTIEIYNAKGEKMHDEVLWEKLLIRAKAFRSKLLVSYTPEIKDITYHATTLEVKDSLHKVGVLRVAHNGKASCIPPIRNISMYIETSRPGCDGHLACFCTKPTTDNNYHFTNRHIQISQLISGQCIDIPIFWNMAEISKNPLEITQYDLLVQYQSNSHKVGEILLKRDSTVTEPDVRIQIGREAKHLYQAAKYGEPTRLEHPIQIAYVQDSVIQYGGDVIFENLARANNHNESIAVWDIKTEVSFAHPQDAFRLRLAEHKTLQQLVQIDACPQFMHLKPRDKRNIHFQLHEEYLRSIEADKGADVTEVEIIIKISYRLFADLDGTHYLEFQNGMIQSPNTLCPELLVNTIHVKLQKQPNPEWMCVDFGTSAIVAGLSDQTHSIEYIDLKQIKDRFLAIAYPDDPERRSNNDEDAPFISSSICLNPQYFMQPANDKRDFLYITPDETNERRSVADYIKYPIWFSPGMGVIHREYQIPCLKMIVGYHEIPNIFSYTDKNVLNWSYRIRNNVNNQDRIERLVTVEQDGSLKFSQLLLIDNLFYLIYKQLFIHYLKAKKVNTNTIISREINQLVLTVPNTYTPYNIDTIHRIARETLSTLYPEYLKLVSESDAVACYYLLHRDAFFRSEVMTDERRSRLMRQENILVYDMGAGTLDLTLFSIECTRSGQTMIDIKSKMGVNVAGNYLDYTLAEILVDLYERTVKDANDSRLRTFKNALLLDKSEAITKGVGSRVRNVVKQYVKDIKKHLNHPGYSLPNLTIGNEEIVFEKKASDIVNHRLFGKFIDTITNRVLTNFFATYGETIRVDTVIFSGRSTELDRIREDVKYTLSQILPDSNNMLYANICDNKFYSDIKFGAGRMHDKLKKVVTEGALAYADRYNRGNDNYCFKTRANYATFGIIICDVENHYEWYPLIERGQVWDERGVISSPMKQINTTGVMWMDFIQTYSSDVVADYQNKRFDMISRLLTLQNPHTMYPNGLEVQLDLNDQTINRAATSALTLFLNNFPATIQPHEDFSDTELRKSLWPVIF